MKQTIQMYNYLREQMKVHFNITNDLHANLNESIPINLVYVIFNVPFIKSSQIFIKIVSS